MRNSATRAEYTSWRAPVAFWRSWRHNGAMATVQIKNVPEESHLVLRRRAAESHQSLQEFLRSWLIAETSKPTVDEVLTRIAGRSGGSAPFADSVVAVREDRDRR